MGMNGELSPEQQAASGSVPRGSLHLLQSAVHKPQSMEIHIEELTLYGMAPGDHSRLAAAVEYALTRLFAMQGVPQALIQERETASLDGGTFSLRLGTTPEALGAQIARALYGGLMQ